MARARPGLANAVTEILQKHGKEGKRLSYRQAERLTGLSPATVGELAKGNARTPETLRRFAAGMNQDLTRLLLLAGFVPEEEDGPYSSLSLSDEHTPTLTDMEQGEMMPEEKEWLGRFGKALAKMPPGRERELWKEGLRRDTELIEAFLHRLAE